MATGGSRRVASRRLSRSPDVAGHVGIGERPTVTAAIGNRPPRDGPIQRFHAILQAELSTTQKMVLLALAKHADSKGHCWPSQQTLMRLSSLSRRAVQKALDDLDEMGVIEVRRRCDDSGRRTSNLYVIDFSNPKLKGDGAPRAHTPAHEVRKRGRTSCAKNSIRGTQP